MVPTAPLPYLQGTALSAELSHEVSQRRLSSDWGACGRNTGLLFSLPCGSLWRASGTPPRPVREQDALHEGGFLLVQVSLAGHNCTWMVLCSCEAAQPRGPTSPGRQGGCTQALLQLGRSCGLKTSSFLALLWLFLPLGLFRRWQGKVGPRRCGEGRAMVRSLRNLAWKKQSPPRAVEGVKANSDANFFSWETLLVCQ